MDTGMIQWSITLFFCDKFYCNKIKKANSYYLFLWNYNAEFYLV